MNIPFAHSIHLQKISKKSLLQSFQRIVKFIVLLLFIIMAGTLGYFWYISVYSYGWSQDQKDQYRNQYAGETSFREDRFDRTVEVLKERIELHKATPTVAKNLFLGTSINQPNQ